MNAELKALATILATKINALAAGIPRVVAATIATDLAAPADTRVTLDASPTRPVPAASLGVTYPAGTRVMCLQYPPRGLLILGATSDNNPLTIPRLRLLAVDDASATSVLHALQIGLTSGLNLIFDSNEIMARNNGAISPLYLQNDGGSIVASDMRALTVDDGNTRTTASTTFAAASTTATLTFPYAASGSLLVAVSGRLNNDTINTAHATVLGFEIRDTNAAGTLREAASDAHSAITRASDNVPQSAARVCVVTGLPTAGTGFIRAMMRTNNAGNQANAIQVNITVMPSM